MGDFTFKQNLGDPPLDEFARYVVGRGVGVRLPNALGEGPESAVVIDKDSLFLKAVQGGCRDRFGAWREVFDPISGVAPLRLVADLL